jgi:integrase
MFLCFAFPPYPYNQYHASAHSLHQCYTKTPNQNKEANTVPKKVKSILTDTFLRTAKPGDHPDGLIANLVLRIGAGGTKTWNYTYRSPTTGKRQRADLGTYTGTVGGTGIDAARNAARKILGQVEAGKDPRIIVQEEGEKKITVADVIALRIQKELSDNSKPLLRSREEIKRRYAADVIPVVGSVPIRDFRRRHALMVTDKVLERREIGKCDMHAMADKVLVDLRALMTFAKKRDLIEFHPLDGMAPVQEPVIGDRFLELAELKKVWRTAEDFLESSEELIIKILIATAKRSNQVCKAEVSEVNWQTGMWTIPKKRVKGKEGKVEDEIVPLSDLAFALFKQAKEQAAGHNAKHKTNFLFPRARVPSKSHSAVEIGHALASALTPIKSKTKNFPRGKWDMDYWTAHDLRRSVATHMVLSESGLEIPELHVSHVLNHKSEMTKGVTAKHYIKNQREFVAKKKAALDAWAVLLMREVIGKSPKPDLKLVA